MTADRPKVLIAAGNGHITEVEMIKGLRQAGIDIHAAFASDSTQLEALRSGGVPTRTLDLTSNADWRGARQIRRWIKDESFDIVHGLANRQVANLIWASYGMPNKVIAYRGAVGHVSRWDPTCYLKWLNPRVDRIVCVSNAVKRDLAASGVPQEKLVTIYKGHDLTWYQGGDPTQTRSRLNEEFNIPADAVLIGMAANMRRVKGADLLLRALAELPANVHGLFIGDIRDPEIHTLAADSRVADRAHFTGSREDAPSLIGALDINVAPSRSEGLPKSIIEGMAQGVPAVVTNVGGLPELVEDKKTGVIIFDFSCKCLANAITDLTRRTEYKKLLGSNAREAIKEKFSIAETTRKTTELYDSLSHTFSY